MEVAAAAAAVDPRLNPSPPDQPLLHFRAPLGIQAAELDAARLGEERLAGREKAQQKAQINAMVAQIKRDRGKVRKYVYCV